MKKNKKIIILITIIIILAIIISIVLLIKKNNDNAVSEVDIYKVSDIVIQIYNDYTNNNKQLIGEKISYSEAKQSLRNISEMYELKIAFNYDGFDIEDKYYYYKISNNDLKEYGIKKLPREFIVNYSTKEVIDSISDSSEEPYNFYKYKDILQNVNILEGKTTDYSITYDLNGGAFYNDEAMTSYNEKLEIKYMIPIPSRNGYSFTGWTGSCGDTPQRRVFISGEDKDNKTYKANWRSISR